MTAADLEDLFFEHVPERLIPRLMRATFTAHEIARVETRAQYEPPEAANILPYARRAKLEGLMRAAADMEPTVTHKVVKAQEGNWFHTELRTGPVVITASSVPTPCARIEKAEFRLTLARDAQMSLWGEIPPAPNQRLYALLLHSPSAWPTAEERARYGHLPGSLYLAFPSPTLGWYVHSINLFERFSRVVLDQMPQEWDEEAKVAYLYRARRTNTA